MTTNKSNIWTTSNLYQGSYLIARGFKLVGTKKQGNKVAIIFEGENIEAEAMKYYNDEKVGSKSLFSSFRLLKDLVFEKS